MRRLSRTFPAASRRPALPPLAVALAALLAAVALALSEDEELQKNPLKRLQAQRRQCFKEALPCIMYSNGKGSFGCAQCDKEVREATVLEIDTYSSLFLFVAGRNEARIIMVPEYVFFDARTLSLLEGASNVVAVITYPGEPPRNDDNISVSPPPISDFPLPYWSDDKTEPNKEYNFYPGNLPSPDPERNRRASGSKFIMFPMNIFHVDGHVASSIRELALRFSERESLAFTNAPQKNRTSSSPRYVVQSIGRMFACPSAPPEQTISPTEMRELLSKVNSSTCLKDRTCLPIGGQSVWSSLGRLDPAVPSNQRNILAITVPMDSLAFFNEFALGASSEISSLAVQMAVAAALSQFRKGPGKALEMKRQPVFFAFNAQSWGYAGSDRFLLDVKEFECKKQFNVSNGESGCIDPFMPSLKFLDLRGANISVLNIGHLVSPATGDKFKPNFTFFTHRRERAETGEGSVSKALFDSFERRRAERIRPVMELDDGVSNLVPLDATMSFRRYYQYLRDVVTIANYNDSFKNVMYHSKYDNRTLTADRDKEGSTIQPRKPLYNVATVIAEAVATLSFGDHTGIKVNNTVIDEVIKCMTANWTICNLAQEYLGSFYEVNVGHAIPGNYPSSFFPKTRLADQNPSGAAKNALVSAFYAFQNAYETDEAKNCTTAADCKDFRERLNRGVRSQSAMHSVFCSKNTCVASDTYSHNAYGTAMKPTNENQTAFSIPPQPSGVEFNATNPRTGDWTESAWGVDLGLCGYVQDTDRYGSAILFAGIGLFVFCVIVAIAIDHFTFKQKNRPRADEELPMLSPTSTIPVPAPVETAAS